MIAVDAFRTASSRRADVFLPATVWGEKSGTVVNLEGRVQRVQRRVAPEGAVMDDWRIAVELAERLGVLTGKRIVVDSQVDSSIMGGIIARVGGKLIDGSTRNKLASLKRELASARVQR